VELLQGPEHFYFVEIFSERVMTQVSPSAAYVRKGELESQPPLPPELMRSAVMEEQVWALLETPQTIESLQRATRNHETPADRNDIERMLKRLLDADLIELSPDS
jgi:hypothetical protein